MRLFFVFRLGGQLYKYTDDQGRIHYTDNYLRVPEHQRPAFTGEDPPSESQQIDSQETEKVATGESDPVLDGSIGVSQKQADLITASRVRKIQAELSEEYRVLSEQRAKLESELAKTNKISDRKVYDKLYQQVQELNAGINSYTERRAKFDQEMQTYVELINAYNSTDNNSNNKTE